MSNPLLFFLSLTLTVTGGPLVINIAPTGQAVLQEAINKLPRDGSYTVIRLAPGVYREKLSIPKDAPPLKLLASSHEETRIVWSDSATTLDEKGKEMGTFQSTTVLIESDDFTAEGITFENDHGPGVQAVALSVGGDRAVFRKCRFLGWQDTLLLRKKRQFFDDCAIEGSVDFIFGDGTAYFQDCRIHVRGQGYITAASTAPEAEFGFVFAHCQVTSAPDAQFYLGRPWSPHASVHFLECELPATLRKEGWDNWRAPEKEKTARYYEFSNTGAGADKSERVSWMRPISDAQGRGCRRPWRVLRKWDPNKTVSEERVARLPVKEQEVWWDWLSESKEALNHSRSTLSAEVEQAGREFPLRPQDGGRPPSAERDPKWYRSKEAREMAETVLSFQTPNGAWSKSIDYRQGPRQLGMHWCSQSGNFPWHYVGTIDNKATTSEVRFLAAHYEATKSQASREGVRQGIGYLLHAQYPTGGWPQVWPLEGGYHDLITLNDDAMIHVMELLSEVAEGGNLFSFVDRSQRQQAKEAVAKGIDCLLNAQVRIDGQPTVWCAQHDPLTLQPAGARMQEPASLSSAESVAVIRFLMKNKDVDRRTPAAIAAAQKWFQAHAITGITETTKEGRRYYEENTNDAGLWWGRFHDLETQQAIFPGAQDGGIYATFGELFDTNSTEYAYYSDRARSILD